MEPNNFEKDFREKLNQRTIEPSDKAWDRLDAMLSIAEEKKQSKKKSKKWLYIAASLVGFLLVGTVYFNRFETEEIKDSIPIVLEQKKDVDTLNNLNIDKEDAIDVKSDNPKIIMKHHSVVADIKGQAMHLEQLENKVELSIKNNLKEDSAIVDSSKNKNDQSATRNKYISAEKLLAEVNDGKFEVKANNEIIKETRKAISVNPNDLLLNAETELNQSFRESALDKFNKNFKVVKSAIVNRNYEE